jgi:hypothetical protein
MKTVRRLRELSDPEALRLFVWSLLTVLGAAALVRTLSLPVLLSHFSRRSSRRSERKTLVTPDIRSLDQVRRYSHAIVTSLLRSRRPCLLRSLVLYRYCYKQGVPIAIHFGVKSGSDGLDGHSWITLDGALFFESSETLRPYTVVYSYPETGKDEVCPRQTGVMVEAR